MQVGSFGPYAMKCSLDFMVLAGRVLEEHLSRWPCDCHGYTETLQHLFGTALTQEERWLAFNWMCQQASATFGGRLTFPELVSHLCWNQRRRASGLPI